MSTVLKKTLLAAGLALAAVSLCSVPSAFAAPKKSTKVKAAKGKAKAKAAHEENSIPDGPDADITDTVTTDYTCELGTKLTIFTSEKDDSHIALRWKKRIHRLDKVGTTTGALRFENTTFGLIWIGIPSKGMLLDAKQNRQLANECRNADQERDAAAPAPVEKQTEQPSTNVKVKVEPILPPLAPLPKGEMPTPSAPAAPVTTPVSAAPPATTPVPATPASPPAVTPAVTPPATTPAAAATATPPVVPATATPPVVPAPATPAVPAAAPAAPATPAVAPAAATPPVEATPVVPAPATTPAAPTKPI